MGNAVFGTNLQNPNYVRYADICGEIGYRVENLDELVPALQQAVSHNKPLYYKYCC